MKRPGQLKRKGYLRSRGSSLPAGRGPIDRRRKVRTRSEFARIYGSRARVRWIKHLPCVACVALSPFFGRTDGSSHNAHTETGGTGYKAGYETIVPLCATHHRRYDEHQPPFDTEAARDAIKADAKTIARRWLECAA